MKAKEDKMQYYMKRENSRLLQRTVSITLDYDELSVWAQNAVNFIFH